ncbi:hypothetical protein [Paraburkholderia sp. MM5384-R2]|uniref:hypothetical protein n=1 Tax=Paraburkholderia sp. MM5384-R2 TaxID=2723097 RepID=UPI0016221EF4|nr:hypothetical protein [Paraburkholderia sp. MM5384-R2]MBB5503291.1 hypothetical protein [Paraburkholderia sp. MM5384-R2]
MNHLPQPVFDQSLPLLDVALLTFCIVLLVWMTGVLVDLRQRVKRLRSNPDRRIDHPTGELQ